MRKFTNLTMKWHFETIFTPEKTTVGWQHSYDKCSSYSQKVMGRYFGDRRPLWKPRHGWENVVGKNALELLHIRDWKAAARRRECRRKVIGEAVVRKLAEAPYRKKNHKTIPWKNIAHNNLMPFSRFVYLFCLSMAYLTTLPVEQNIQRQRERWSVNS
jgi:hypothetical protein